MAPAVSWGIAIVTGLILDTFSNAGGAAMLLIFLLGNVFIGAAFLRLIGGARALFFWLYLVMVSGIGILFLIFATAAVTGKPLS